MMSPLAQMRSADRVRKCLLFGVDRTYRGDHETDAFDPKRTSTWPDTLSFSFAAQSHGDRILHQGMFPGARSGQRWKT
jgi:hypothetical protein